MSVSPRGDSSGGDSSGGDSSGGDSSGEDSPGGTSPQIPSPAEYAKSMTDLVEKGWQVAGEMARNQSPGVVDPLNVARAFGVLAQQMMADPAKLIEAQTAFWRDYTTLCQQTTQRFTGGGTDVVDADGGAAGDATGDSSPTDPGAKDFRFRHEKWREDPLFDFIKQSYLLTARWIQGTVSEVEGLDKKTAEKVDFYTRQLVDAMAPTNFLLTNPQALEEIRRTEGKSLVRGLENLLDDLKRGKGRLKIQMVDDDAFALGENIAVTSGKVVFQNDLMQLIQYAPATEEVARTPLLIIPPWINKYYILDLSPENSFIRWAIDQGHTVFCISWVNPDSVLAEKTFDDYLLEGPLAAMDAIARATDESRVHMVGYCLGGTLLAATLAWLKAQGDDRAISATYFTSMVDFSEPGDLGVFIDEEQIEHLDDIMDEHGYLDGREMSTVFNMLRANELIWSFVINNYLMGRDPIPYDLLYWNSDSTRMPAAMHSFYIRKMYHENRLIEPGGLTLADVPIDVHRIDVPSFIIGADADHIAPWKSVYQATQAYKGDCHFLLADSGHIAGIINPPKANKYGYWTNTELPADPDQWRAGATKEDGSWWPIWHDWLAAFDNETVPARTPGDGLAVIENAPGGYALKRLDDDETEDRNK